MSVANTFKPETTKEEVVYFGTFWGLCMALYGLLENLREGLSLSPDSVLFEYIGLSAYKYGTIPYADVWDIKPPLTHELMYIFSFISQGDPVVLHILSICFCLFAITMTIVISGNLVYTYTENKYNAYIAVLLVSANTHLYDFAFSGFRPKYIVMLLGVTALYLMVNGHFRSSNLLAVLCPALWQLGIIFPIITIAFTYKNALTQKRTYESLGVMALVTGVVIAPFIYVGAFTEMIQQVVFTPFIASENMTFFDRYTMLPEYLGIQLLFYVGLGVVGISKQYISKESARENWWIYVLVAFYLFQVLFLDLDYYPDVFLLTTVVSIFYGITLNFQEDEFYLFTIAIIILYIFFLGETTIFQIANAFPLQEQAFQLTATTDTEQAFLNSQEISNCHVRMSRPEEQWMKHYAHKSDAITCATDRLF